MKKNTTKTGHIPKPKPAQPSSALNLEFHPLTSERWQDLEALFGPRGACGGCWCMFWRVSRSQFDKQKGEGNRKALKKIVDSDEIPGILAYTNEGKPLAWCSVAPRENYPVLERSRVLKRIDEKPVWSVVCFFVAKSHRGRGVTVPLLKAAVNYAKNHGAKVVEGYPTESEKPMPASFIWTGLTSMFLKAGFVEVARGSKTRPIMRCFV